MSPLDSCAENLQPRTHTLSLSDKQAQQRHLHFTGRVKNRTEARKEFERNTDPNFVKSQKRQEWLKFKQEKKDELRKHGVADDQTYLVETAERNEAKKAKLDAKRANKAAFGWDVFNQDTLYRAYEKRLKKLPQNRSADDDDGSFDEVIVPGQAPKPTREALSRMVRELKDRDEARAKFSRRRAFNEDATVDYINQRNAVFNKKISRAFDKYTTEIKQNLERGTAL